MMSPVAIPALSGSLYHQWRELQAMPEFNSRTIFVLPPKVSDAGPDVVYEDVLHQFIMMQKKEDDIDAIIYKRLAHMIDCLHMLLGARVNQRPSKWYEVNSQLLRVMVLTVLPNIIGVDVYNDNAGYIHDLLGMPMVPRHLAAVCSRQVGKTLTSCIVAVLVLMAAAGQLPVDNVPVEDPGVKKPAIAAITVDYFAQSGKTAHSNIRKCLDVLNSCLAMNPRLRAIFKYEKGTEKDGIYYRRIASDGSYTLALLQARSADGDASRGEMNDVTIYDEFGFYDEALLTQADTSRTAREGISTIWITTHSSTEKAGTLTVDIVNDPDRYFGNGYVFESVFICNKCRASTSPMSCRHRIDIMPIWRDVYGSVMAIEAAVGNSAKMEVKTRELLGMAPVDNQRAIPDTMLTRMFSAPHVTLQDAMRMGFADSDVYVTVDPDCGSRASAVAAVVSMVSRSKQQLILGAEYFFSLGTDIPHSFSIITSLVRRIYLENPEVMRNRKICWQFEGNNNEAVAATFIGAMRHLCAELSIEINTITMDTPGAFKIRNLPAKHHLYKGSVWTDNQRKQLGKSAFLYHQFLFAEPFLSSCTESFVCNINLSDVHSASSDMYQTSRSSASPWEYISRIMRDHLSRLVNTSTGGLSGKQNNQQDDMAQVILMASYYTISLEMYKFDVSI